MRIRDPNSESARHAILLIQTFVGDMACYATALELALDQDAKRARQPGRNTTRRRPRATLAANGGDDSPLPVRFSAAGGVVVGQDRGGAGLRKP
jgi:hypothetical protein